jgi:hypothetical protein
MFNLVTIRAYKPTPGDILLVRVKMKDVSRRAMEAVDQTIRKKLDDYGLDIPTIVYDDNIEIKIGRTEKAVNLFKARLARMMRRPAGKAVRK